MHPSARIRTTVQVMALAAVLPAALNLPALGSSHAPSPAPSAHAVARGSLAAHPVPAGDEVVAGTGDTSGWHLFAASSGDRWRWHPLATLRPGGYGDEGWIGQQCLTGDGRLVIAVVAPWHANNSGAGMDRGGIAYAVDAHTGRAWPLASGVSLAYFNPGCGTGHLITLTSYLGRDEGTTRVAELDAAKGAVLRSATVHGELTSAIPDGNTIIGVRGSVLVRVGGTRESVLARLPGQAFDVLADGSGGADLLVAQGRSASVWQVTGAGTRKVATGALARVRLFAGRGGHNLLTGARASAGARVTSIGTPAGAPPIAVSADGQMVLAQRRAHARPGAPAPLTLAPAGAGQAVTAPFPRPAGRVSTALPGLDLAAAAAVGRWASQEAGAAAGTGALAVNTSTPTCAVPRNDLWTQVPQPNSAQIQWAVQQAVRSWLVPGNTPARPDNPQNYLIGDSQPLPQFYPSQDFPPPAIAGHPGAVVPPQVMYGILAQESNWNQASWHALAGYGGNPLVANYYGSTDPANPTDINYDTADCGYGVAQITDLMKAGAADVNTQTAIAVDYAENIAAGVTNLVGKWNQLASLGDLMNNGDPAQIEDWYAAIWAYNSGVHTTASGDPASGLGWRNNPANPIYPANRHPFLCADASCISYTDASIPQDWPYQEKVLGWIEAGQYDPNNPGSLRFTPLGSVLDIPSMDTFCRQNVNNCDPAKINTVGCTPGTACDPCPNENSSCWWNQPVTWASCPGQCTQGSFTITSAGQPEPSPTSRPMPCSDVGLPGTPILVDDNAGMTIQNPHGLDPNVVGCPTTPTWQNNGSFELDNADLQPLNSSMTANIDLHQIGTGLGGHAWFSHTRSVNDAGHEVVGRWTPNLSTAGVYEVFAYVPTPGATTTHASYVITDTGTNVPIHWYRRTLNQNLYNDQWVSLGFFPMHPGSYVTLGSVTPSGDASQGADIAYSAMAFVPVSPGSYVALGDSYSSGQGSGGPWDEGTSITIKEGDNSGDNPDSCHRSSTAYSRQYAALTQTFRHTDVAHLACSGSTMYDLAGIKLSYGPDGTVYYGTPPPPGVQVTSNQHNAGSTYSGEPSPQVDQLALIPSPKLVTLSIGGNDIGFGDVAADCLKKFLLWAAAPGPASLINCQSDFTNADGSDQVTRRIQGIWQPLYDTYTAIKNAVPSGTAIVVLTYPGLLNSQSGGQLCSYVIPSDVPWLMGIQHLLDQTIISAAKAAGVGYLDEEKAFSGHELCTSDPWFHAPDVPPSLDSNVQADYYHPNAEGYAKEASDLHNYLSSIP